MKLSLRVWLLACGFCWLSQAHGTRAQAVPVSRPVSVSDAMLSEDWAQALERRIDRMLPMLLSSLYAVRRQHDKGLERCFDRAIAGLNSVQRQVSYHADLRYEAASANERVRHTRALVLLGERADELARSVETCFTDGVELKHGQTVVEVVLERL